MDSLNVNIIILPDDVDPIKLEHSSPTSIGVNESTEGEIFVNRTMNQAGTRVAYSVIYRESVFQELNPNVFMRSLVRILERNLPNHQYLVGIFYNYTVCNSALEYFDEATAEAVIDLHNAFEQHAPRNVIYRRSSRMDTVLKRMSPKEKIDPDEEWYQDPMGLIPKKRIPRRAPRTNPLNYLDQDDDDTDEFDDDYGIFNDDEDDDDEEPRRRYRHYRDDDDYDDFREDYDDDDDDYEYRSPRRSRVVGHAKNPKKAYRRHGVVIATDTDDLDRDEEILKKFLREFIPGDSDWKRQYRKDVLKRWMRQYAVSKKRLNKLQKEHRKNPERRSSFDGNAFGMDIAKRILENNSRNTAWYDPKR